MGSRPLGQHFLTDPLIIERILAEASVGPGQNILEIGPGRGALTYPLLISGCRVTCVEVDPKLAQKFKPSDQLVVVQEDFLQVDLASMLGPPDRSWKVVANLPYYVTTPILEKLLSQAGPWVSDMWLMMQHEVAERIVTPGQRTSGSLTHFVRYHARADYRLRVPPSAFAPPPEVDSAVVHFAFLPPPDDCVPKRFFALVRGAFAQRRKMLRSSLKAFLRPEHFEAAGIDPQRRPETLQFEDFLALEKASRPENSKSPACST